MELEDLIFLVNESKTFETIGLHKSYLMYGNRTFKVDFEKNETWPVKKFLDKNHKTFFGSEKGSNRGDK